MVTKGFVTIAFLLMPLSRRQAPIISDVKWQVTEQPDKLSGWFIKSPLDCFRN